MPIYEFYCPDCNTIYNFFCRRIVTDRRPACPHCGRLDLKKLLSRVSVIGRAKEKPEAGGPDLPLDESRLEQAMGALEHEMAGMDENDPRAATHLMRRLAETTGMELNEGMQEAIRRMEAGEDPDQVEAELGDVMGDEKEIFESRKRLRASKPAPRIDEELYEF